MCILSLPKTNEIQEISDPSSQVTVFILLLSLSVRLGHLKNKDSCVSCMNLQNYLSMYTKLIVFAHHKANYLETVHQAIILSDSQSTLLHSFLSCLSYTTTRSIVQHMIVCVEE